MAAHSHNFIRVRLHFDYPPPAVVDCRMCWLLVDLNECRVVADLESVIREKFEFSRGSILSLFVEDCYLPHTESVYVVRDNDSVRVKVGCLAQVNGPGGSPDTSENGRKRRRAAEEDGPRENGVSVERKKKKKRSEDDLETVEVDSVEASEGKKKKKRKKAKEKSLTASPKPAASKKSPAVEQPLKRTKKPPVAPAKTQIASSSDSSSSSEGAPKKPAPTKPAAKKPAPTKPAPKKPAPQKTAPKSPSSTAAASKAPPTAKPTQPKSHPPPSSSSESASSSSSDDDDEAVPKNTTTTPKGRISEPKSQQGLPEPRSANGAQKQAAAVAATPVNKTAAPCNSDSDEEIKLVIRRPTQQPPLGVGGQPSWRGRGRGQMWRGGPREGRGGGRGVGGHGGSFEYSYNGAKEPSCQTDSLTNVSVLLQNGAADAPKQDYSSMPLLAAPPQVGQKIAFKLLELTENYTPEVSDYKEGKIVSLDLATKQIELELLTASKAPVEPGKFDLVYQNPDGSEIVEYAVSRGSRVTERWESLLEPRLII